MREGYIVINNDYVSGFKEGLKSILVFNHKYLNEAVNHFVIFNPRKQDLKGYSDLVGVWKIKSK